MASMQQDLGDRLNDLARRGAIKTHIERVLSSPGDRNLSVRLDGVTNDEARTIIDTVIKIEQARVDGCGVLSPTDYRNRFSGLDLK